MKKYGNIFDEDIRCADQSRSRSARTYLKGSGGIVGITNQKSALVRWTLTKHFIASLSSAIHDRAGIICTSNTSHEKCDIISAISQNQSTSENNFWIDMTGYDFTRFAFQGCFGIHVFKCFQL
jgi:hypothetical protein